MNKVILIILLIIPLSIFASGKIETDITKSVNRTSEVGLQLCLKKISKHRSRVQRYPRSIYFKWRLRYWIRKCELVFKGLETKAVEKELLQLEKIRKRQVQEKAKRQLRLK